MTLAPLDTSVGVAIGNDAGWTLTFHDDTLQSTGTGFRSVIGPAKLTISRDDYYAEIEALLPGDFSAGRYTFTIEGLTDGDYADVHVDDVVRLYLYWRDTNGSPAGYLANVAGLTDLVGTVSEAALRNFLVAELVVTRVSRRAGTRRYETTIEARERVYVRLQRRALVQTLIADTYRDAAQKLVDGLEISVDYFGFTPSGTLAEQHAEHPGDDGASFDAGLSAADALSRLGKAIENVKRLYGRGMLLIRRGTLTVGSRPIPPTPNAIIDLSFRNGLIETVLDRPQPEPTPDDPAGAPSAGATRYHLTLKGRPDLSPGDVVRFRPAPDDVGKTTPSGIFTSLVGAVAGPLLVQGATETSVTLYVDSVQHKLGRTSAFATMISGVVIGVGDQALQPWDTTPGPGSAPAPSTTGHRGKSTSPVVHAAQAIKAVAADAAAAQRGTEIGEVRAVTTKLGAQPEPPSQTETVWRGLVTPDGRANQGRRLAIRRKQPAVCRGVAYATPFAWGMTGLVLPRYPGTRVVLLHRNGDPTDPVDLGALWESGEGPDSRPGDWWLILPAGIDADRRESIQDSEAEPGTWLGSVTQDLIDADGNRIIHVGELTIRAGELQDAGQRTQRAPLQQGITIEHATGDARITIDQNGKIVIEAAADLELVSKHGDIKLSAAQGSVDVSVANAMDVH